MVSLASTLSKFERRSGKRVYNELDLFRCQNIYFISGQAQSRLIFRKQQRATSAKVATFDTKLDRVLTPRVPLDATDVCVRVNKVSAS